jgi:hypothetical protein
MSRGLPRIAVLDPADADGTVALGETYIDEVTGLPMVATMDGATVADVILPPLATTGRTPSGPGPSVIQTTEAVLGAGVTVADINHIHEIEIPMITVGTTAPTSPNAGDLWVDTN